MNKSLNNAVMKYTNNNGKTNNNGGKTNNNGKSLKDEKKIKYWI
jgi:hypothetical protein